MPDEDKKLTLGVSIQADTTQGDEVKAKLEEIAGAGNKEAAATAEGTKKAKLFNLEKGETKKLIRELAHEFPLAGMAVRALLNPMVFAITVGIGLFAKINESIKETNKALDEAGKAAAENNFQAGIEAKAAALNEFAKAAAAHQDAMAHLIDPEKEYQSQVERSIALLHEQYAATVMLTNAEKGRELQAIDTARELIQITDLQARQAREAVENKYTAKAAKDEKDADAAELARVGEELHRAKTKKDELDKTEGPAEARAKATAKKSAGKTAELEKAKADAAAIKAAYDKVDFEAVERMRKINALQDKARSGADLTPAEEGEMKDYPFKHPLETRGGRDKAIYEADYARQNYLNNRGELNNLPKQNEQTDATALAAKNELERIRKEKAENDKLLHDLQIKIADLAVKFALKEVATGRTNDIARATRASKSIEEAAGTPEGKEIARASAIEKLLAQHKKITAEDAAFLKQFLDLMTTGSVFKTTTQATIVRELLEIGKTNVALQKQLDDLQSLTTLLQSQVKRRNLNAN